MGLTAGTRFGAYEILRPLGEGVALAARLDGGGAGGGEPVVVTRRGQALHDEIPVLLPDRLRRIPLLT
jgi:hypothetical protein